MGKSLEKVRKILEKDRTTSKRVLKILAHIKKIYTQAIDKHHINKKMI